MKAFFPLCAVLVLTVAPLVSHASEPAANSPGQAPDPTNPFDAVPTVVQPAPEMPAGPPVATPGTPATPGGPAAPTPANGKKPDPALDLLPTQPGQLLPEPTLTPENPTGLPPRPVVPGAPAKIHGGNTEVIEQDLALRIRFRQAKTRALDDPAIQAEWHNSIIARTDLQRRDALTRYYKLLYARMLKDDKTIGVLVATQQALSLGSLQQSRMAPTQALDANDSSRRGYLAAPFTSDQF